MEKVSHRTKHANDDWPWSQTYFSTHVSRSNFKFLEFIRITDVLKTHGWEAWRLAVKDWIHLSPWCDGGGRVGGGHFDHTVWFFENSEKRKLSVRSSQLMSPGQVKRPHLQKYLWSPWGYSFQEIYTKLTWIDKGICTYKAFVSEAWFQRPEVRSMLWPDHYKAIGKCSNTLYFKGTTWNMLIIACFSYIMPLSSKNLRFDAMTSP